MKLKYLFIAIVGLIVCSCSSVKHTSTALGVDTRVVSFTVADLDVQPTKVSKTYSWNYNPFRRISINTIKTNTTALLLQENDADILVEPQYIIEKRGFLRGGSVTVIGFPASYKDFHKMNETEAIIMKAVGEFKAKDKDKPKRWLLF